MSKRKRFEIFKRDRFTCAYCGRTPPDAILEIDHIAPRSKGGDDSAVNLITSCRDCNRGKSNTSLDEAIPSVKAEIVDRQERLAQLKAYNRLCKAERQEQKKSIDEIRHILGWEETFTPQEEGSIHLFLRRLPLIVVEEAAEIAVSRYGDSSPNRFWRYFCGICWKRIRQREDK